MKRQKLMISLCIIVIFIFSFIFYTQNIVMWNLLNEEYNFNNYYMQDKLISENKKANENEEIYKKYEGLDSENIDKGIEYYKKNYIEKNIFFDIQKEKDINYVDGVIANSSEPKKISLHAMGATLMDASNGRVLFEKDGNKQMPMASTTKIMTCIVALENGKLDDIVKISSYAASMPDVQLNARAGEEYYLKDLLYALMLESYNDVAVAVAEHIGGSVEGFAQMMNNKAKELGCNKTNFVTPSGLDADEHYTTAIELGNITSYAIKNKDFINITNASTWSFKEIKKGRSFVAQNKDRFLYTYDGAIGVKTGFTNKAGYCFVGAVDKDDKLLISVVLGSGWPPHKNYKWKDTGVLMDYGINNYEKKQIFNYGKTFEPIMVKRGQKKYAHIYHYDNITALINDKELVQIIYKLPYELEAPIEANTKIGTADYYIDNNFIKSVPIYTTHNVLKVNFKFYLDKIMNLYLM